MPIQIPASTDELNVLIVSLFFFLINLNYYKYILGAKIMKNSLIPQFCV